MASPLARFELHLERLGAIVIAPRAALRAALGGQGGGASDVVPWLVVGAAVAEPIRTGHALLVARADPLAGASMLIQAFVDQWLELGVIVLLMAALGVWARRVGRHEAGGDRVADAALLAGLPFVYLTCAGALLDAAGIDLRFMPHHRLVGPPPVLVPRVLAAFGWSSVLWLLLLRELFRSGGGASGLEEKPDPPVSSSPPPEGS